MEIALQLIAVVLFAIGAISDIMKREVRDELSIALWLFCAFAPLDKSLVIVCFAFIWAIAILGEKFKTKIFGWGDVLWGAPFIGIASTSVEPKIALSLFGMCFVAGQVYLHWQYRVKMLPKEKVRGVPFVAYLLVALILALLI